MEYSGHNKKEYPPMHTAEHVINRTAVMLWNCGRSVSAHIERKKSRMDFLLPYEPTNEQVNQFIAEVNRILQLDLPVSYTHTTLKEAEKYDVDLTRIPSNTPLEHVRIVHVGNYDDCLCVGAHVEHTAECGEVVLVSHNYQEGRWRLRFKLQNASSKYDEYK